MHCGGCIVVAGVIPDIDGIFILWDSDLFYTYHHTFGHSFVMADNLINISQQDEVLKNFKVNTLGFQENQGQ